jgi:hypothetical protein
LMVLGKRELGLTEIRAARNLWDWHRQFEKDEELKKLAEACDAIYKRNPLVEALDVFFSYEMYELAAKKAVELGEKMGKSGTRDGIREFLDQVIEFAPRNDFGSILRIAEEAATYWETNAELQELVNIALTTQPVGLHYTFAITLLNRRLRILRQSSNDTTLRYELQKAIQAPPNPEAKVKLLLDLYSRPHPLATGILSVTDFDFAVAETDSLKPVLKRQVMCQILAGMCHAKWDKAKSILETAYNASEEENRMLCLAAIFDTIHFLDLFRADYPILAISERTFTWLLDLVVTLPDIDEFGEYREHEMSQLVEKFGRRDLAWLCSVLDYRVQTFGPKGAGESESSKIAPRRHRLTIYVRPLDPPASSDSSVVQDVGALLDYAMRKDMLGYIAPQYAIDIDPKGVVVPGLIILRIESVSPKDINSVWVWARFAGYYRFNSIPWKQIAKSAVKFADGLAPRDAGKVFVELLAKEFKSSNYPAGEMDPRPEQDLNARRNELEQETDSDLAPFRKWHLAMTQAEFDLALAQYKERNEQ